MSVKPVPPPPEPASAGPSEKRPSGTPWRVWLIIAGACCFLCVERSSELEWEATATPLKPGVAGERSFFADESGVIRFRPAERGKAGRDDPAIGG